MPTASFNLNSLKGRLAEHLVKDLFAQNGYNVFSYGLEQIQPTLSKKIRNDNHKTSRALRYMPDFVVQSSNTGDLFYLEVKFRANGCFRFDDKYKDYPYKNAWFVIVSPEKMQCMHYKRLIAGFEIMAETRYHLSKVKWFHLDKEIIAEYEGYARQVFQAYKKE
ncbi:MAG: hypothetical protein IPF68_08490 [Bacteroidales bacterium]|nr:hypothetical protein [Bacteroidales bacterium]